jgi:DNA-binding MarR family transcriptional regulator
MRDRSFSSRLSDRTPSVSDALSRVKGMFVEMPGTAWTVTQAARLSGLDISVCKTILKTLEEAGFLIERASGTYVRCLAPLPSSPAVELH